MTALQALPQLVVHTTPEERSKFQGLSHKLDVDAVVAWYKERKDVLTPAMNTFCSDYDGTFGVCLVGLINYRDFNGDVDALFHEQWPEKRVVENYDCDSAAWHAYVRGLITGWDHPYSPVQSWQPFKSVHAASSSVTHVIHHEVEKAHEDVYRFGIETAQACHRAVQEAGITIIDNDPEEA